MVDRVRWSHRLVLLSAWVLFVPFGCATPEPTSNPQPTDAQTVATSGDQGETHSEWVGGGHLTVDDMSFELPADPAYAVAVHPAEMATLIEHVSSLWADLRGTLQLSEGWTAPYVRTGWVRILPVVAFDAVEGLEDMVRDIDRFGDGPHARMYWTPMEHLDPSRRVVLVMGEGRRRREIRRKRLRLGEPPSPAPDSVQTARFVLPATDAEALAGEFRSVCRRAERPYLKTVRRRGREERGLSGAELEAYVDEERWADRVCGKVYDLRVHDDYVVADVILGHEDELEAYEPVELSAAEDRSWRRTAAVRAFEQESRAFSLLTTSRATAALAQLTLRDPPWISIESSAFEFEDVALFVGNDGAGGWNVDAVQTYTRRGRRIEEAGRVATRLPRLEVPGAVMRAERAWNIRKAAEQTVQPRWLSKSAFQSKRAGAHDVITGFDRETVRTFHVLSASPTMALYREWHRSNKFGRRGFPEGIYGWQPAASRSVLGLRPGADPTSPEAIVAGGYFRMMEGLAAYIDEEIREWYGRWTEGLDVTFRRDDGSKEAKGAYFRVAMNADWRDLASGSPSKPAPLEIEANLGRLAETIPREPSEQARKEFGRMAKRAEEYRQKAREAEGGSDGYYEERAERIESKIERRRREEAFTRRLWRRALDRFSSFELTSRGGEHARMTHLHLGPGESRPVAEPEQQLDPIDPQDPPRCLTDIVRRAAFEEDRDLEVHEQYAAVDGQLAEMREGCDGLTDRQREDVRLVLGEFHRRYGGVLAGRQQLGAAAEQFGQGCRDGNQPSCTLERIVGGLERPTVGSLQARADESGLFYFAGPAGLSRGDELLFEWPALMQRPVDGAEEALRERYDEETRLGSIVQRSGEVGGNGLYPERSALRLDADRSLPVGYVDRMLFHLGEAHRVERRREQPSLAMMVQQEGTDSVERGWYVLKGREATDAGATVRIGTDGIDAVVGGQQLAPVDGCPAGGPTLCLDGSPERLEGALEHLQRSYRGESDAEAQQAGHLEEIMGQLRVDRLGEVLGQAAERSATRQLQIIADERVPVAVVARVVSSGLFDRRTKDGREQIVGERFGVFYLKAAGS